MSFAIPLRMKSRSESRRTGKSLPLIVNIPIFLVEREREHQSDPPLRDGHSSTTTSLPRDAHMLVKNHAIV
jgi:hypothetical protein